MRSALRYGALVGRPAALAACLVAVLVAASSAGASPRLKVGIYDEAQTLGNPEAAFPFLAELRTQVLRVNLRWDLVAPTAPAKAADPEDPAYDWVSYDRIALLAQKAKIRLVFSIFGTPGWANGGRKLYYAPRKMSSLRAFALAAARRYSGKYQTPEYVVLPKIDRWMAWNEPNAPTFLRPQFVKVGKRFRVASGAIYARICNAVWSGVHAAGKREGVTETVACGVTNPRGNNVARSFRPSVSPLVFLRAMHAAGAKFDVYAHHPYPPSRFESPNAPARARTTVTLGSIDVLIAELDRLYKGRKRVWITEYGYQTNPPDRAFGVSRALQARYLRQAYAIARRHPRIDLLLWFLLRDEPDTNGPRPGVDGWQSGLLTYGGKKKPAFDAFRTLPR